VWQSDNLQFKPDARDLVLIPPNVPLTRRLLQPLHHGYIHFTLGMPLDLYRGPILLIKALPYMREYWQELVLPGDAFKKQFALGKLINHVMMEVPFNDQDWAPCDLRIEELLVHLHENTHRLVSNQELAQRIHLSESAMIRRFTHVVGKSPQAIFTEIRLDEAANLLRRDPTMSIEQIAQQTGFFDRSHFCKRFVLRFGITPAAYRKMT
jgi:AraC-like DNA-binding protein